jgi:hypothetical protein
MLFRVWKLSKCVTFRVSNKKLWSVVASEDYRLWTSGLTIGGDLTEEKSPIERM